ncbi:hypothetical protein Btru_065755, partial [Bulinus truncatus]
SASGCDVSFVPDKETLVLTPGQNVSVLCDSRCLSHEGAREVTWSRDTPTRGDIRKLYSVSSSEYLVSKLIFQQSRLDMAGTYSCYILFNNRKLHRKSLNVTFHGMKDKNPNALNTRDIDGQRVRRSYWYSRCPDSLNPYIIISSIYWHCLHSKLRKQELFSRNLRRQRLFEKRKQTTTYVTKQTFEWTTRQFTKSNIEENIEGSGDSSGEYIELPESSKHLILQDITQRKNLNSSNQMSVDNIILGNVELGSRNMELGSRNVELGSRNVDTDFEVNKENTHEDFMAGNTINQQAVKSAGKKINIGNNNINHLSNNDKSD